MNMWSDALKYSCHTYCTVISFDSNFSSKYSILKYSDKQNTVKGKISPVCEDLQMA